VLLVLALVISELSLLSCAQACSGTYPEDLNSVHNDVCGDRPEDWCCTASWDNCNKHNNIAECKRDPKCVGLVYFGESYAVCRADERDFGLNCPTVGCITACSFLSEQNCRSSSNRCRWGNSVCARKTN